MQATWTIGGKQGSATHFAEKLGAKPTAIDLFAGAGGMSLGLENAGFNVLYANELVSGPADTYRRNFPSVLLEQGDIRNIEASKLFKTLGGPAISVLSAGTPCQGFSCAGPRQASDPRNMLYKEVLRFATVFSPKFIVIENVAGLLSPRNSNTTNGIIADLKDIGYHPHMHTLVASHFGVPQRRSRVFIIAPSKDLPKADLFPEGTGITTSVGAAIADLAFLGSGEEASEYGPNPRTSYQRLMRGEGRVLYNHESSKHSERIINRFARIPPGSRFNNRQETKKQTHLRLHPRRLSNTITSIPEDSIHYRKNRGLTVREMARLQSFPDSFEFMGPRTTGGLRRRHQCPQYTQVANAVPPFMAEAVFRTIAKAIIRYF